ncbi:MAG: hypothetical protein WA118_05815 [Carboxydocellales bacterium]
MFINAAHNPYFMAERLAHKARVGGYLFFNNAISKIVIRVLEKGLSGMNGHQYQGDSAS